LCLAAPVSAQPITLNDALEQAYARNPRLQASQAEPRVAAASLVQAHARPNPILSLNASGDSNGLGQTGLSYSQELELGGKREARIAVAQAEQARVEHQVQEARRQLALSVKQAFYDRLLAQEVLALQLETVGTVERQLELTRAGIAGGRLPGMDATRLEGELARRQAAVAEAQAEVARTGLTLGRLLGLDQAQEVAGELGRSHTLPPLEELLASQSRPDVQAARGQAEVREREVSLEEARGVSNLTLLGGLGYERIYIPGNNISPQGVINFIDDRALGLRLQLSIPLPISDTNEGNIEKARVRAEQARLEERALVQEAGAELRRAYHRWEAAAESHRLLATESLPRSARVLDVLEQAFRLGARSSLELWLARQNYLEVRLQERRAAWSADMARIEVESAWGGERR